MSLVSSLAVALLASLLARESPPPLRVCADPNNMPFSNAKGQGFENRIARLLAHDLERPLDYFWMPQRRGFVRTTIAAGRCDLVMGMLAGSARLRSTRPYYRSSYAFVTRHNRHLRITSFDDRRLKALTIGIQLTGDDYANPPAAQALAARGLTSHVRGFTVYGNYLRPDPQRDVVDAVASGDVDVAVVWGPVAGYFARRQPVAIDVVPVNADPALPFAFDVAMGVRRDDTSLRNAVDRFIDGHRVEIRNILMSYGVPLR